MDHLFASADAAMKLLDWADQYDKTPLQLPEFTGRIGPAATYTAHTAIMLGAEAANCVIPAMATAAFLLGYHCGRMAPFVEALGEIEEEG